MGDFISSILNMFSPTPSPKSAPPPSIDDKMAANGWKQVTRQPDGTYAPIQPTAAPTMPVGTPPPEVSQFVRPNVQLSSQGFRYQMGKHDYSDIAPQVQNVLKNTPLEPYADNFVQAGNEYGVDPRVLVTVAHNESSLGRNYPKDSFNPFGYNAGGAGNITGPDGKQYVNVDQGLRNAGFTSIPMAIDRLTNRFSRQPTTGYQQFYKDPSVDNLQAAYNANPAEQSNYIKNAQSLVGQFK